MTTVEVDENGNIMTDDQIMDRLLSQAFEYELAWNRSETIWFCETMAKKVLNLPEDEYLQIFVALTITIGRLIAMGMIEEEPANEPMKLLAATLDARDLRKNNIALN